MRLCALLYGTIQEISLKKRCYRRLNPQILLCTSNFYLSFHIIFSCTCICTIYSFLNYLKASKHTNIPQISHRITLQRLTQTSTTKHARKNVSVDTTVLLVAQAATLTGSLLGSSNCGSLPKSWLYSCL
jgi:hypothetical protein